MPNPDQANQVSRNAGILVNGTLDMSVIKELRIDVLKNWDTSYPILLFKPCHSFQGEKIDPSKNRQIPRPLFHRVKLLEDVVTFFETLYKQLRIEQVWLL